jgi:hypothetical protein
MNPSSIKRFIFIALHHTDIDIEQLSPTHGDAPPYPHPSPRAQNISSLSDKDPRIGLLLRCGHEPDGKPPIAYVYHHPLTPPQSYLPSAEAEMRREETRMRAMHKSL